MRTLTLMRYMRDTDAQVFQDYAVEKLGVPANRIKTLVNDAADERGVLLAVIRWLTRMEQGQSDVCVFFCWSRLASDDGEKMYLLPYDGAPELLIEQPRPSRFNFLRYSRRQPKKRDRVPGHLLPGTTQEAPTC